MVELNVFADRAWVSPAVLLEPFTAIEIAYPSTERQADALNTRPPLTQSSLVLTTFRIDVDSAITLDSLEEPAAVLVDVIPLLLVSHAVKSQHFFRIGLE